MFNKSTPISRILMTSFVSGMALYVTSLLSISLASALSASECSHYDLFTPCPTIWDLIVLIIPLVWILGLVMMTKLLKRLKMPSVLFIMIFGTVTIPLILFAISALTSIEAKFEYVLLLYPISYGGYSLLFSRLNKQRRMRDSQ